MILEVPDDQLDRIRGIIQSENDLALGGEDVSHLCRLQFRLAKLNLSQTPRITVG